MHNDFKIYMGFVISLSLALGGLNDNQTPFTCSVFFCLWAISMIVLFAANRKQSADRHKNYALKAIDNLTLLWSLAGTLMLSNMSSKAIVICFIIISFLTALIYVWYTDRN